MTASSPRSRVDVPFSRSAGFAVGDLWPSPTRSVDRSGSREVAALEGDPGRRVFTITHVPARTPVRSLVICSPVHAEFLHNYRKEVLLARALAASGVAVQRLHYRGTGNSEGDPERLAFHTMLEDTLAAATVLARSVPGPPPAFLGTRSAAAVAAAAAANFDEARLALWEPVLDPAAYFREVSRTAAIQELRRKATRSQKTTRTPGAVERLRAEGMVDVLGYAVHRRWYEGLLEHPLRKELSDSPRSAILVQLDRRETLRQDYADLVTDLRRRGWNVLTRAITADEHWWFSGDPADATSTLRSVIDVTSRWLLASDPNGGP